MNPLLGAGALLFAGLLPACSSTPPPRASDASISLRETQGRGVVTSIRLTFHNTSDQPLPLRDLAYDLYQDNRRVFSGVRSAQCTLQRFGSQTIDLPAAWSVPDDQPLPSADSSFRLKGRVTYLVPGALAEVLFDAKILRPTEGFSIDAPWRDQPPPSSP